MGGSLCTASGKQKNVNIEMLRVIACFLVIIVHVRPMLLDDSGAPMDGALLMQALSTPGVGIFFLISGCFVPLSPVRKALKGFFWRTVLPALALAASVYLLEGWLSGNQGFLESILQTDVLGMLRNIVRGILAFDTGYFGNCAGHLWFIFGYAVIMLWMPLLHVLVKAGAKKEISFFVILSIVQLLIIDINKLWSFPVQIYLPQLPPVEILYAAAGYLIFQKVGQLRKHRTVALGAAAAAGILWLLLFFAQRELFVREVAAGQDPSSVRLFSYYLNCTSGSAVLLAILVMIAVLGIPEVKGRVRAAVCALAAETYPVFLLHFPIIYKLQTMGVEMRAKQFLASAGGSGAVIYTVLYSVFIFLLSALIWQAIRLGIAGIKYAGAALKNR